MGVQALHSTLNPLYKELPAVRMLNLGILISILGFFLWYDLVLRVGGFFHRDKPVEFSERIMLKTLDRIFSLLRAYRGFRIKYENPEGFTLPERFILVVNHQSVLDIPVLYRALSPAKLRFVAKKKLGFGVPLVSTILRVQGHCLVSQRGEATRAMRDIARFTRRCEKLGYDPVIFPEGTRSRTGELGTFHTGGFRRMLGNTATPIVVVALDGGWRIFGIMAVWKHLSAEPFRVRIVGVLPAPSGKKEVGECLNVCRGLIDTALSKMRTQES